MALISDKGCVVLKVKVMSSVMSFMVSCGLLPRG